ncbi:ABC transporter substrate-binding protein [Pseudofrankia saprophytica]|uniref:ABC transporter substrate-binding protein n=1 Tax=Pseudofrankia saprophytica TaxID=298655 RepID=UPI000234D80C|nr:ABC transporter substrate-binding protein [Pseudofrankia saprophytica]
MRTTAEMRTAAASLGRRTGARPGRRSLGAVLAASLALVVFGAACGSDGDAPSPANTTANAGVLGPVRAASGEPVKIGIISDGATPGFDASAQLDVADATAAYLNERRSGIGGRPIKLVKCKTQGDPSKATDCANQLVSDDLVAVAVAESGVIDDIWRPLAAANVPTMVYGAGSPDVLADNESTFALGDPNYATLQMPISLAKKLGVHKVTAVVIDVPAALHSAQEVAPGAFAKAGLEYQLVTVPPGTADMTPQMQNVAGAHPGLVFVIGNDSFCISAFNGLRAVGFDGKISAISQCVTDATRKAVPADALKGMIVSATVPNGGTDPSTVLYDAVLKTYSHGIGSADAVIGRGMFMTLAGLATATEGISGTITPATVIATIKAMPERELPGSGGQKFRCNGKADPADPAVCVRGGLSTTLDDKGQPTAFEVLGSTPIGN